MSEIKLGYGHTPVVFAYDEARFRLLEVEGKDEHPLTDVEVGAALDAPIDSPLFGGAR